MSGGSVSISYGEGVHDWGIQDLQLALSTLRRFLATADRFKLLLSEINFVRVNTIFHDEIRQEDLTGTDPGLENQPAIPLPAFERDLVSLHSSSRPTRTSAATISRRSGEPPARCGSSVRCWIWLGRSAANTTDPATTGP